MSGNNNEVDTTRKEDLPSQSATQVDSGGTGIVNEVEQKPGDNESKDEQLIQNESKDEQLVNNESKDEQLIQNESKDEQLVNNESKDEQLVNNESKDEQVVNNESKDEQVVNNESKDEQVVNNESKDEQVVYNESKDEQVVNNESQEEQPESDESEEEQPENDESEEEQAKHNESKQVPAVNGESKDIESKEHASIDAPHKVDESLVEQQRVKQSGDRKHLTGATDSEIEKELTHQRAANNAREDEIDEVKDENVSDKPGAQVEADISSVERREPTSTVNNDSRHASETEGIRQSQNTGRLGNVVKEGAVLETILNLESVPQVATHIFNKITRPSKFKTDSYERVIWIIGGLHTLGCVEPKERVLTLGVLKAAFHTDAIILESKTEQENRTIVDSAPTPAILNGVKSVAVVQHKNHASDSYGTTVALNINNGTGRESSTGLQQLAANLAGPYRVAVLYLGGYSNTDINEQLHSAAKANWPILTVKHEHRTEANKAVEAKGGPSSCSRVFFPGEKHEKKPEQVSGFPLERSDVTVAEMASFIHLQLAVQF